MLAIRKGDVHCSIAGDWHGKMLSLSLIAWDCPLLNEQASPASTTVAVLLDDALAASPDSIRLSTALGCGTSPSVWMPGTAAAKLVPKHAQAW